MNVHQRRRVTIDYRDGDLVRDPALDAWRRRQEAMQRLGDAATGADGGGDVGVIALYPTARQLALDEVAR